MKKYFLFCFLLSFDLTCQNNNYNVFKIGKGELFKQNYNYLEYLFDNKYAAELKNTELKDHSSADLTGVLDERENTLVPFIYRNITTLWDNFNQPPNKYIQISNPSEKKGKCLLEINGNSFKTLAEGYLKFRYFIFGKSYITAYKGSYDIINLETGKVINTDFIDIEPLTKKFIAVHEMGQKWGINDIYGNEILPRKYDNLRPLTDSLVLIKKRDSLGILNQEGKIILPTFFKYINLANNLIVAQTHIFKDTNQVKYLTSDYSIKQTGKCGAFDKKGNIVIPFEFESLSTGINNNLIAVKNNRFEIISERGEVLSTLKYTYIESYFDNLYLIKLNGGFGVLNSQLKQILPIRFEKILPLSKDMLLVLDGEKWYKITIKNDSVVRKKYLKFKSNVNFDYMPGCNDKNGLCYDYLLIEKKGSFGIIKTKKFSTVVRPEFQYTYNIKVFEINYFNLLENDTNIYFTIKGKKLKGFDLSKLGDKKKIPNRIICKRNGKFGVINNRGKTVVPFLYKDLITIDEQRFIVNKN